MDYFKLLELKKEPFSNSPDPDFFYQSRQHLGCLQKLELAIRLRRGLNVVIGDIGTGKTTLCRELIRRFDSDPDVQTHLILDPSFASASECLKQLYTLLEKSSPAIPGTQMGLKEAIKQHLFAEGVERGRTTVLIIDEGQKITSEAIEILRELLNYETNSFKLLQIVIFAQPEIETVLKRHANFADRINLLHELAPMNFSDTRRMIHHRLKLSSKTPKPRAIFTLPALWAIYRFSQGYPRKVIHLCHQSVLAMIIQNRSKAGWAMIRSCRNRLRPQRSWLRKSLLYGGAVLLVLAAASTTVVPYRQLLSPETVSAPIFKVPAQRAPSAGSSAEAPHIVANTPAAAATDTSVEQASLPQDATDPAVRPEPASEPPVPSPSSTQPAAGIDLPLPELPALAASAAPPEPPELLGTIRVKPGDTLFKMVASVYGRADNRSMRAVIEANPHIHNPNTIDLDDKISFPVLRHALDPSKGQCYWIVVDQQTQLDAALNRLHILGDAGGPPLRIIAHWHPTRGLLFWVAAKRCYPQAEAATADFQALPAELAAGGRIESQLPEGAYLFSHPY